MIMDTAELWLTLLCVCNGWILSPAISCDWRTQYEYEGRCCPVCPSGEYPEKHCSESSPDSVCKTCPTEGVLENWGCFCENKRCSNDMCSRCEARQRCKAGHQLSRVGNFDYSYFCKPCPEHTYNDVEDGVCKPITTCDGFKVVFAGNRTHNARCDVYGDANKEQANDQSNIIIACLAIVVFLCLVLVMYTVFQRFKHKRDKKLFQPCTHRVGLPSDACSCKLSKEEMGHEIDSKMTLEFSCDSSSIP